MAPKTNLPTTSADLPSTAQATEAPGSHWAADDSTDPEACPGCGWGPGDGINPNCDCPVGCGYWRDMDILLHGHETR